MKNGLRNINRYCNGARSVETGIDPELKPVIAAPVAAKKDDKKAGKKEEEPVMNSGVQVIDVEKEKELKKKVESSSSRTTINAYWQIKMTF